MPLNGASIREAYRSLGPAGFARWFERGIGLRKENGQLATAPNGMSYKPVLEHHADYVPAGAIDARELALGILGDGAAVLESRQGWRQFVGRNGLGRQPVVSTVLEADGTPHIMHADIFGKTGAVLEAGGTDMVPSMFPNISTYNTAILGLLEAKTIESYNRPEFKADEFFETDPTRRRSERWGGVSLPGDSAVIREPGDQHARIQLSERYVTTRDTQNYGLGIDVTYEAEFFDYFKQLMAQADKLGYSMALKKEKRCMSVVLGVVSTYTYDGNTSATYATSGSWVNKLTGNELTDYTKLNAALQLFTGMTDQETGQPIEVIPKDIYVMPDHWATALNVLYPSAIWRFTGADPAATNFPAVGTSGPNPMSGVLAPRMIGGPTWPYLYNLAQAANSGDAPGLALSASDAGKLWLLGDFKRAFKYVENFPLTITRITNNQNYEMADRRLTLSIFADEMGTPEVFDPRYVAMLLG